MKILLAALLACVHLTSQPLAPVIDGLLTDAATDFTANAPHPADLRGVHAGLLVSEGKSLPIVCGQFLPANGNAAQWTDFSTTKTSGYEQALGWQATALCGKANLDSDQDLTLNLKTRIGLK